MTRDRLLQAPPERVYEAFTTREQVERWWGPDGFSVTTEQMDVRVAGTWRFTMHGPDGVDYLNEVTFEELSPPEQLAYRPVLTMKAVFDTAEARDLVIDTHDAVEGGNQTLGRLEVFLSGVEVG